MGFKEEVCETGFFEFSDNGGSDQSSVARDKDLRGFFRHKRTWFQNYEKIYNGLHNQVAFRSKMYRNLKVHVPDPVASAIVEVY